VTGYSGAARALCLWLRRRSFCSMSQAIHNMRPGPFMFQCCAATIKLTHYSAWGGQSFGIPGWTGNESISWNPSGVPILNGFAHTAH
jgi:hypothetical protein